MYDGYHFSNICEDMYNPYSLLHAFDENDFGSYFQGYATPYAADKRKLFKIGVNFSSTERIITEWVVE